MATLNDLSVELQKLQRQIRDVLRISGYAGLGALSGLDDYRSVKGADDLQKLEEYRGILDKLTDISADIEYLQKPMKYTDTLHQNAAGRYEDSRGRYYTSGSPIEFLRKEEVLDHETGYFKTADIWTCSRIESRSGDYYIVGYPDAELDGLKIRVRGQEE